MKKLINYIYTPVFKVENNYRQLIKCGATVANVYDRVSDWNQDVKEKVNIPYRLGLGELNIKETVKTSCEVVLADNLDELKYNKQRLAHADTELHNFIETYYKDTLERIPGTEVYVNMSDKDLTQGDLALIMLAFANRRDLIEKQLRECESNYIDDSFIDLSAYKK